MTVETYRGIDIKRTSDVLMVQADLNHFFCITVRERAEDSAPIVDMFPSVEKCREAIDWFLEENPPSPSPTSSPHSDKPAPSIK